MRVCEKLLGQAPCWHSLFSAGIAGVIYRDVTFFEFLIHICPHI